MERAQKDRARRVSGKRGLSSDPSSDGVDADMDDADEDEDEEFLNDEVRVTVWSMMYLKLTTPSAIQPDNAEREPETKTPVQTLVSTRRGFLV